MEYPTYLVRPTDHSIFKLYEDGKYRHIPINKNFINVESDSTYKLLIDSDFYPCEEKDIPEVKKKGQLYYQWLSWHTRPDGHGGSKGGTMEEFLEIREKYEL